jgi:hypothetical protein
MNTGEIQLYPLHRERKKERKKEGREEWREGRRKEGRKSLVGASP